MRWPFIAVIMLAGSLRASDVPGRTPGPTFATDIAPILYAQCASCHNPAGEGPFPLLTYDQVRRRSRQISEVVESRFMPPWKPVAGHVPALAGARELSGPEIAVFRRWHESGAPAGDLSKIPPTPAYTDGWKLGPPDLVLSLSEPFELPPEGRDIFRNFVIPIPLDRPRYIRAVEFRPEARGIIHHASIELDSSRRSRDKDAADPGPGWASMELGDTVNPNGHIIGWTPGQIPYEVYPGTAWELETGTDLVIQLHLLPSGRVEKVAPQIGLYFTDTPPTRATSVVQIRSHSIDIPAGASDHLIEERLTLPVATGVLRLFPHAHYLGKDLRIHAELPDGRRQPLLHIPDWDFNWQSDYTFQEPVSLPAGAQLVMRYRYDNSVANPRNPSNPPQRVTWGWGSKDEMAGVVVQLLLDRPEDWKPLAEVQCRQDIAIFGETPYLLERLGSLLEQLGRMDESITVARRALVLSPTDNSPRLRLARLLRTRGDRNGARQQLEAALVQSHQDQFARQELALVLIEEGQDAAARALLEQGLSWHRTAPAFTLILGRTCMAMQDWPAARIYLELATTGVEAPLLAEAWHALAIVSLQQELPADAKRALTKALEANPDHLAALVMVAGFALVEGENVVADVHLLKVAQSTRGNNPPPVALVSLLPSPAGPIALARALRRTDRLEDARSLLMAVMDETRERGAADEWAILNTELTTLPEAPPTARSH